MKKLLSVFAVLAFTFGVVGTASATCLEDSSCFPGGELNEDGRQVFAGGDFTASSWGESQGLLGDVDQGHVTDQYAGSDNMASTYGNLDMDVSTCSGDSCSGMRVGFEGHSMSAGTGWSHQTVTNGPARAAADSLSTGHLNAEGFVVRRIAD